MLRYGHGEAVTALSYNPATLQLASGAAADFGLWSPEQKAVTKHKVGSKVLCAAWSGDGSVLAVTKGCAGSVVVVASTKVAESHKCALTLCCVVLVLVRCGVLRAARRRAPLLLFVCAHTSCICRVRKPLLAPKFARTGSNRRCLLARSAAAPLRPPH